MLGARYWLRDGRCRIPLPRPRVGGRTTDWLEQEEIESRRSSRTVSRGSPVAETETGRGRLRARNVEVACQSLLPPTRGRGRQAVPDAGFEACAHSARVLEQKTLDSTRKCIPLSSK